MKYGKIDPEAGDEEEQKYDEKKRKAESDKKSFQTKINIEGHLYDLEDGQVVNYIEIYIPFLRRYCRINACDFFQYLFGSIVIIFNIWLIYILFFEEDDKKAKSSAHK